MARGTRQKLGRRRRTGYTVPAVALLVVVASCAGGGGRPGDDGPVGVGGGGAGGGGVGPGGVDGLAPGDHSLELLHGGRTRGYIVHVPPVAARAGDRLPLVLALHGGGGNANQFKGEAGLDAIADREGFLAVYPHGTGPLRETLLTWNAGSCCGYASENGVDDVGFLVALVDEIARRTPVDRARVYATGHSNGGMMSHRLGAEVADRFAAIAPVAGGLVTVPFAPSRPVPILHIHSVDDPRALYEGGLGPPFPLTDNRVLHPSVEETLQSWRDRNACEDEPAMAEQRQGRLLTRTARHTAERLVWSCSTGAPVEHWRLHGVGHGWPGALQPRARESVIGPTTDILSASEEAWAFFERHRLPAGTR